MNAQVNAQVNAKLDCSQCSKIQQESKCCGSSVLSSDFKQRLCCCNREGIQFTFNGVVNSSCKAESGGTVSPIFTSHDLLMCPVHHQFFVLSMFLENMFN